MIPSMDMEITSDDNALALAATNEHTCPPRRQITCDDLRLFYILRIDGGRTTYN